MMRRRIGDSLASYAWQEIVGLLLTLLTLAACSAPVLPGPLAQASNTTTKSSVESWQMSFSHPLSDVQSSYTARSDAINAGTLEPDLLGILLGGNGPTNSFNFAIFDYQGPGTYHIAADEASSQKSQSYFEVEVEAGRHTWGTRARFGAQASSTCTVTVSSVVSVPAPAGIGNAFHEVKGTAACHALPSFDQNDPTADVQNGVFDVIVISN